MVTISANRRVGTFLDMAGPIFQQWRDRRKAAQARRKVFRQTVFELSSLSDRDLGDLGIARCEIKRLAMEAANGSN